MPVLPQQVHSEREPDAPHEGQTRHHGPRTRCPRYRVLPVNKVWVILIYLFFSLQIKNVFKNYYQNVSNIVFSLKYSGAEDGYVFPALYVSCLASVRTSLSICPRRATPNSAFLSQMVRAVRKMRTVCTG